VGGGDHHQGNAQLRPVASSTDAAVPNVPGRAAGQDGIGGVAQRDSGHGCEQAEQLQTLSTGPQAEECRMGLLALPEDEQQIIRHLCEQEGLQLLRADLLQEGSPRVAADPLAALAPSLPSWKRLRAAVTPGVGVTDPTYQEVWEYLLWAKSLGPIRTLDDAPAAPGRCGPGCPPAQP
jgi:hypothetical protein